MPGNGAGRCRAHSIRILLTNKLSPIACIRTTKAASGLSYSPSCSSCNHLRSPLAEVSDGKQWVE